MGNPSQMISDIFKMSDNLQHISLALYQYMCQHIVGSEEIVKTKRVFMAINDKLSFTKKFTVITSGSFGEGLELKGSDFDYMIVLNNIQVHENLSEIELNPSETYFTTITDDVKSGFVKLQLVYSHTKTWIDLCVNSNEYSYLSNFHIKDFLKSSMAHSTDMDYITEFTHGPCLTDREGKFDFVICVHQKTWIKQAENWIERPNLSWPSDDIKSEIKKHGVLFVPIGIQGSPNEEIEWRVSFSVGEKILVNSFTHTQLLCYVLMKIFLKDIINTDMRCQDLLCSYYIKNIIFWVSQELPPSIWKPCNMLTCFMKCLNRLIYCVEYSFCPHYFIPERNMFEDKIFGSSRLVLLYTLRRIYTLGWKCILLSPQLQDFPGKACMRYTDSQVLVRYFEEINNSAVLISFTHPNRNTYSQLIKMLSSLSLSNIKSIHLYNLPMACKIKAEKVELNDEHSNKRIYEKYKICQSYLLQGINRDAVTGWLYLASLFYKCKQYRKALNLLLYALSKCTKEKVLREMNLSRSHHEILKSKSFRSMRLNSIFKSLRLDNMCFDIASTLIPAELAPEVTSSLFLIPPVVYAHFLSFLCHFHLVDATHTRTSLEDLKQTISKNYFIINPVFKSTSFNCLGIAHKLVGDKRSAEHAFHNAIQLDPSGQWSCAKTRLCEIDKIEWYSDKNVLDVTHLKDLCWSV